MDSKEIKSSLNDFNTILQGKYQSKNPMESKMTPQRRKIVENYIKGLIRKEKRLNESLNENNQKYYISYYATVGEHGEAGTFSDFKQAIQGAKRFVKDKDSEGTSLMDGLEYLGVESTYSEDGQFAILFITEPYIKRLSPSHFDTPESYKAFVLAAKKCLTTGKPAIGKY